MGGNLEIKNLTKNMGKFILSNISFTAYPGEILGIIGVNGSGKTTLIRTIIGAYKFDDGSIKFGDFDSYENQKEYRCKLAYVMEKSPFSPSYRAKEIGELYGPYYSGFDMDKYMKLLAEYDILPSDKLNSLSKGQKIKQQIAFAMSYDAECFIFDEPTGNLDVDYRDEFYEMMRNVVANEENVVLYATHLVDELEYIADRILWMERVRVGDSEKDEDKENGANGWVGRVKCFMSIDELKDSFRVIEAPEEILKQVPSEMIISKNTSEIHSEVMVDLREGEIPTELEKYARMAELREIMYHIETGEE
ncbi:MAG: ABC transporter ATP-binding protein [Lachnospiraceae bacterium]|nr:ABC transporter ATP-binding protein [Lachnospiraceae bacterium]